MADITMSVDDSELRKALNKISNRTSRDVMSKALTKTAFDVRDAERRHVSTLFEFAGPTTRQFFVSNRAFRVGFSRPATLVSKIYPAPRTGAILKEHVNRVLFDRDQHLVSFKGSPRFAVPINTLRRGSTGKVPKNLKPSDLLKTKKNTGNPKQEERGFIRGNIIFLRKGKKRKTKKRRAGRYERVQAVYFLAATPTNTPTFEWIPVARKAARENFDRQVRRAMLKEFPPGSRFRP